MSDDDREILFESAVIAAEETINRLWKLNKRKVFAFVPGLDHSPARIRRSTSTRAKYDHFRARLAATIKREGALPPNLLQAAAQILEGNRPNFKKQADLRLILSIGMAVKTASKYVPIYRNDGTETRRSACDAVVQAASLNGREMTYAAVAKRYRQYLKL